MKPSVCRGLRAAATQPLNLGVGGFVFGASAPLNVPKSSPGTGLETCSALISFGHVLLRK